MAGNKVYFCNEEDVDFGYYIAADNEEKAIDIFYNSRLFDRSLPKELIETFSQRKHYTSGEWDGTGKVVTTDCEGILSVKQLGDLGLLWFQCAMCGDDDFEFVDGVENYRCKKCGHTDQVPYY